MFQPYEILLHFQNIFATMGSKGAVQTEESFKHSYKAQNKDTVSLAVYNVGYQKCHPLYQWGPGIRDHYLIHHVLSGRGYYTVRGVTYPLGAGDTFLVYPFTEVSYCADANDPWQYYWVGFSGSDAKFLLGHTDFTKDCPVISTDFGDKLKDALLKIYNCRGQSNADGVKMTGRLYLALGVLMEHASARHPDAALFYAQKAMEFIGYNYSNPISVEDIADYCKISRSQLYRIFMAHSGVSPKAYLSDFRLRQACRLLESTGLSVGAIANSVGFENSLYFSKVFRKSKGMTPSAYRGAHAVNPENKKAEQP